MDNLASHVVSRQFTPSDKDERRDYLLRGVTLSDVAKTIQGPLAKLGLEYTYGGPVSTDLDSDETQRATFMPMKWNADGAKLGLAAVEVDHDGPSGVRIIELYGLPVTKPAWPGLSHPPTKAELDTSFAKAAQIVNGH